MRGSVKRAEAGPVELASGSIVWDGEAGQRRRRAPIVRPDRSIVRQRSARKRGRGRGSRAARASAAAAGRVAALLLAVAALPAPAGAQVTADTARAWVVSGRSAEATPILVELAEATPADAAAQYWAGRGWMEQGRSDRAEDWLEKATQLEPGNTEYWLWLGRSYGDQTRKASIFRKRGLALKTKDAFERAVATDAGNLAARSHLIDYHLEAPGIVGGDTREAERQAAAIQAVDEPRGLLEVARVNAWLERWAEAEAALAQYDAGPAAGDAKALAMGAWARGRLHERAGDDAAARTAYEEALRHDPYYEPAREALERVR
jgi:tetratricopeptide (TPR) repeat protein